MTSLGLTLALLLAAPAAQAQEPARDLAGEIAQLRGQLFLLGQALAQREERLDAIGKDVKLLAEELGSLREKAAAPPSGPFLSGPPSSSDSAGVAKVAVFGPRVEVESARRHDLVSLRVRRIEAAALRPVGELDLGTDQDSIELPLDQNGALYLVDWSTSEGHAYALVLRDGATGQAAATVQVKPLQKEGRFIFVGYRLE
jgi:hypothetical protein